MSKSSMFSIPPAVVFFIVSPLLALFLALKNLVRKSNGIVLILFYAVYGYSHSFLDSRGDSYRKYLHFLNTAPNGSYSEIFEKDTQGKILDIFCYSNNYNIFLLCAICLAHYITTEEILVGKVNNTFKQLEHISKWKSEYLSKALYHRELFIARVSFLYFGFRVKDMPKGYHQVLISKLFYH